MGLSNVFKNLLNIETHIDGSQVPKWVRNAQYRWESKIGHNPYDLKKTFYGKTFEYTCEFKTIEQGKVEEIWWKRKR